MFGGAEEGDNLFDILPRDAKSHLKMLLGRSKSLMVASRLIGQCIMSLQIVLLIEKALLPIYITLCKNRKQMPRADNH